MSPLRVIVSGMASLLLLAGCGTFTTLAPQSKPTAPEQWTAISIPDGSVMGWLDDFDQGKVLRALVDEAVGNNYDLATAVARVKQSSARARIAGADLLPQAGVTVTGSRSQRLRGSNFDKITANQFSTNFDISWEIDLWGRLRNLKSSTLADLRAAQADYQAARLSLATRVVSTVLNLVESRQQAEVSRQTLTSLRTNLDILDAKLEAGDVDDRTALEITLSRADVLRTEATLAANERQADAFKRVLEGLLGRYPDGTIQGLTDFPQVKRQVSAGLPSELLLRRPDLIAAEQRVLAATEDVRASWKALLPNFTINAGAGTSTTDKFSDLLDPKALVWDLAGRLGQAVFQGGRLVAGVELSKAQLEEIASRYAETALRAFREVETALAAEGFYRDQQRKLEGAVEQANLAEELALGQYEKGLVDIITVLESQRRAFDARSNLLRVRNERLQNRLDLYLALGGDFDHGPNLAVKS
ncbi:MAG: multidrug efflux system outer membrane protein [Verrucomicrobiales bacterium]|jgi:multidrug efflux system outer membrane protein